MDKEKRYEIAVLADDYYTKRQRSDAMAFMNTPADPADARKRFIEYQLALAETVEARRALAKAQNQV